MKKNVSVFIFLLTFLACLGSYQSKAQSFQEGDWVLSAGLGLGQTYSYTGSGGLPLGVGAEYGVTNFTTGSLGVGADLGFTSFSDFNVLTIGGRGSYHYSELVENKLDLYAGLGLYYRSFNWSNGFGDTYSFGSGVYAAFHLGARYYFSENVGAYAELGNNWGWMNVGVAFKL